MPQAQQPFIATVGYVRGLGIRTLCVYCRAKREGGWPCHHSGSIDVSTMSDGATLASIETRLACTACGAIGMLDVRPDWSELHGVPRHATATCMRPPTVQR